MKKPMIKMIKTESPRSSKKNKFIFLLSILLASSFYILAPVSADAASPLVVSPVIIDEKALPRDILKDSITIESRADRKIAVYAFVYNLENRDGQQEFLDPSRADFSTSLANWISVTRGVMSLNPGERRKIDLTIDVNLRAKPGVYHAVIAFGVGDSRAGAEVGIGEAPAVAVNLEVLTNTHERLQLRRFIPEQTFFSGYPALFSYELLNSGDIPLSPSGEIRIYNRKGEEVATINANEKGVNIEPKEAASLIGSWTDGKGFGKYKAVLDMDYGTRERGTVQDTVFFWVIPWQKMIAGGVILLSVALGLGLLWHREYEKRYLLRTEAALKHLKTLQNSESGVDETAPPTAPAPVAPRRVVDLRKK